jgi:hypothetical protein
LVSLPPSRQINGRAVLWALTLLSFLGGTYYGYQFRKAATPADMQMVVVARGGTLVAQWDGKLPRLAAMESAQLRVSEGAQERVVRLDRQTLLRGELPLDVDPARSAEVELVGQGVSGHARFLAGDPLDSAAVDADADSLRQQLADQQELNQQMERKLGLPVK